MCICLTNEESNSKSFKVTVPAASRDDLLNEDLWPEGVIVRKFFNKRNNGRH